MDGRASDLRDPASSTGFTTFLHPKYTPTNPSGWSQEVVNLANLPKAVAHPTLLCYTSGGTSKHIGELISKSGTKATISPHHLRGPELAESKVLQFFEPYFSRLPKYSSTSPQCQPTEILATNWISDEFAGYGSYLFLPTGLENGDQDVEVLRKGLPGRKLWFAGEHTAPFVALGTVTGAYWSGDGVAKMILGI
jgi:hypothetical protein